MSKRSSIPPSVRIFLGICLIIAVFGEARRSAENHAYADDTAVVIGLVSARFLLLSLAIWLIVSGRRVQKARKKEQFNMSGVQQNPAHEPHLGDAQPDAAHVQPDAAHVQPYPGDAQPTPTDVQGYPVPQQNDPQTQPGPANAQPLPDPML